jgi:hypothetical protein
LPPDFTLPIFGRSIDFAIGFFIFGDPDLKAGKGLLTGWGLNEQEQFGENALH